MNVQVRVLGPDDKGVLMNVAPDVFDGPIDPILTSEFLHDPRHHIVVAIHDDVVVGFASAVHYVHPDKAPQLWINEVAVAPPYQRRGLAQAMLRLLFDVGRSHRCTVAWVLTDRTNAAAMALYASLGGREGPDDEGPSDATLGYSFDL
jgi:ribosomal protein S18 acetylase RimI-like enzyme